MKNFWKEIKNDLKMGDLGTRILIVGFTMMLLVGLYSAGTNIIEDVTRRPVRITVENGKITELFFPARNITFWPSIDDGNITIEKNKVPAKYWKGWIDGYVKLLDNPWYKRPIHSRGVKVDEKIHEVTYSMGWETFRNLNPDFIIE